MLQFIANGLCSGAVYLMVALGFGLIYYSSGIFHLAHAAIIVFAGYILYWLNVSLGVNLVLAGLISLVGAGLLGLSVQEVIYRPLYKKKAGPAIFMISSLGVYIVLINVIALLWGNETKILRPGVEKTFVFAGIILTKIQSLQLLAAAGTFFALYLFLHFTNLGRTSRAISENPVLAEVMGINVSRYRMIIIATGSVISSLGLILQALDVGMDPYIGFPLLLSATVACIIGGMRRFLAPALGAIVLGLLQSVVIYYANARWATAVTFAVLILFLLFRPQGFLGTVKRVEEA